MRTITLGAVLALAATSVAAEGLPDTVTWTAYDTGSSGYNQAVAIGAAMQEASGTNLRILPGKNDLSRLEPVRQGKVQFSANGVGTYMAQEGVFEFGDKAWGPQKVRLLMNNVGSGSALVLAVTKTGCEKAGKPGCEGFTHADMKGLNVSYIKGAPALNTNAEAWLAYGGLTWDDVNVVEFGGYGASWTGMVDGSTDAAFAITTAGNAYETASSPHGIFWPPVDPDDKEAFDRLKAVAPYYVMTKATLGAELDGTEGKTLGTYPYPILMAYDTQDADLVYNMTKAMVELFDKYEGNAPGANGWALGNQVFDWVVPFHEGAVKYYQEAGVWTDAAQSHNDMLIERQNVLAAAWEELTAANPDGDWTEAWAAKRKEALGAAGMPAPM